MTAYVLDPVKGFGPVETVSSPKGLLRRHDFISLTYNYSHTLQISSCKHCYYRDMCDFYSQLDKNRTCSICQYKAMTNKPITLKVIGVN